MYYAFHMIESIASFEKATRFDSTNACMVRQGFVFRALLLYDDATTAACKRMGMCR